MKNVGLLFLLSAASSASFSAEFTIQCNDTPIAEVTPAIVGADLEGRIDQVCARVGEFESLSDSDKGFRLEEMSRLMKRLYPEEQLGNCSARISDGLSAYVNYKLASINAENALSNLGRGSSNDAASVKGICTSTLLDFYDDYL